MSEEPGGKSKKKKWDQTKIVDESLLIEKSSFQPIFKLGSKILFGLLLFAMVLLTTSIRKKFDTNLIGWFLLEKLLNFELVKLDILFYFKIFHQIAPAAYSMTRQDDFEFYYENQVHY